jgi:YbgC/YbaW family acyl-CoA thioester hydrolase
VITEDTLTIGSVPYADCDPSGVIHHARLIEYCERARIALLAANGMTINKALGWGYKIATGKVTASFHQPVRPGDDIVISSRIKHVNSLKVVTCHELRVGEQLVATVECTTVFLDESLRPKQLPDAAWSGDWNPEAIADVDATLELRI